MSMCESSRYSRQKKQMTAFSLGARLPLGANGRLALSLPQSYCLNPLCSPTAPSSEGAEAAPPQSTELQKCVPQLSPPQAGCPHPSCCGATPQRATFPVRGRSSAAGGSLRFAAVALSFQNVPARRAHIHFSCARRARFMCRRHASCAIACFICEAKKSRLSINRKTGINLAVPLSLAMPKAPLAL